MEEFGKKKFKSYFLLDFAHTSRAIIELFDEIQLLRKARHEIKYLAADRRYRYLETQMNGFIVLTMMMVRCQIRIELKKYVIKADRFECYILDELADVKVEWD